MAMYYYFGSPGCGKTTLAVFKAKHFCKKKNRTVYSNFPVQGLPVKQVDPQTDIGTYLIENAILLIDEAGIEYSNREFKNFKKKIIDWYKLHRHYNCDIYFFSQAWDDSDKKIRDLCSDYFYIKKIFCFTKYKRVKKYTAIDELTHQIIDGYEFIPWWIPFQTHHILRNKYYKYFDSWAAPVLPEREFKYWDDRFNETTVSVESKNEVLSTETDNLEKTTSQDVDNSTDK